MGKAPISTDKIEGIYKLRSHGYSIPEIHEILKLPKSTVLRYSKKVEILSEFKERWLSRRNASKIISERQLVIAQNQAKQLVQGFNKKSWALVAASLYWAEGTKKDFSLTNSDPEMIRVFINILRSTFSVKNEDIKVSIRLYEDLVKEEVIKFWSGIVGFDLTNKVQVTILSGRKVGKLKFGMCRVRVRKSGLLLKTIFAINKLVCKQISS